MTRHLNAFVLKLGNDNGKEITCHKFKVKFATKLLCVKRYKQPGQTFPIN